jgi:hypothetical protein
MVRDGKGRKAGLPGPVNQLPRCIRSVGSIRVTVKVYQLPSLIDQSQFL